MDIRELRIEDRVSHNGDIGKVVEIKTTHVRLMFKDGASCLYNVNELEPIPITKVKRECSPLNGWAFPLYFRKSKPKKTSKATKPAKKCK